MRAKERRTLPPDPLPQLPRKSRLDLVVLDEVDVDVESGLFGLVGDRAGELGVCRALLLARRVDDGFAVLWIRFPLSL